MIFLLIIGYPIKCQIKYMKKISENHGGYFEKERNYICWKFVQKKFNLDFAVWLILKKLGRWREIVSGKRRR